MLFQKEKDYGNTITKIGRKKNKKNETAKKKRKITRFLRQVLCITMYLEMKM